MAWDAVPWFVGGGAQHSPEVARLLAYAATGSVEGVITPGDLKVTATPVPGGSVDIAPGDCLIRNRAQGGQSQTYVGRNPVQDNVTLAATGSTTRSDLIVAQIEDPFLPGEPWQDPADPAAGPYVFTRVIPNVPPWTTRLQDVTGYEGRTALALARVDIPASTGTITDAMITDLRHLAMPRSKRQLYVHNVSQNYDLHSTTDDQWIKDEIAIEVPEWATSCQLMVTLSPCFQGGNFPESQILADVWVRFCDVPGFVTVVDVNQGAWYGNGATVWPIVTKWDTIQDPNKRAPLIAAQGTVQKLQLWGRKNVVISTDAGWLNAAPGGRTMITVDAQFTEDVV